MHAEEIIHSDADNVSYILRTSYTRGLIGLPVWQIIKSDIDGSKEFLFTVERVWQETEPGIPILHKNGDDFLFRDRAESYVYSISTKSFTENRWTDCVYAGDYQINQIIEQTVPPNPPPSGPVD